MKPFYFTLLLVSYFSLTGFSNRTAQILYSLELKGEELVVGNLLEWRTLKEANSKIFIIEKSFDGLNYESIGSVDAGGNTAAEKGYRFLDTQSSDDQCFYRLREKPLVGDDGFSRMVKVARKRTSKIVIKAFNQKQITEYLGLQLESLESSNAAYKIQDLYGKIIKSGEVEVEEGLNNLKISTKELPDGVFRFTLVQGDESEKITFFKGNEDIVQKTLKVFAGQTD
jgi:hypothetical protein